MFTEGELLYLRDPSGRRHWFRFGEGMIRLGGLGAVDGKRFEGLGDGSPLTIAGTVFHVFRPAVTDLIESLDRGAQIITPKDACAVIMECDVCPGCRVIEVGAGSGGLTTALTNAVGPEGHVHTVELKEQNAERVAKNLRRTGLDARWSFQIGDAKDAGISFTDADVLTVDMPEPELALPNLVPCLRPGGRICIYVPNANQLELAVNALRGMGFADVRAMEIMRRGMEVHPGGVRPSFEMLGHTGYLAFGRKCARHPASFYGYSHTWLYDLMDVCLDRHYESVIKGSKRIRGRERAVCKMIRVYTMKPDVRRLIERKDRGP